MRKRIMDDKPIKVKIICYYNLILPAIFIFGSILLFIFPKFVSTTFKQETYLSLFVFILLSIFYMFSSHQYMHHKKLGWVCLMISCIIQVLLSIKDLTTTYMTVETVPPLNIIMMIIGLWGLWFLNTEEAKNWIN